MRVDHRPWTQEEWRYHAVSVTRELAALQQVVPALQAGEIEAFRSSFYIAEDRLADLQGAAFADGMPADLRARISGLQELVNRIAQAFRRKLRLEL